PCLSLVELLGLDPSVPGATSQRVMPRMLIVAAHGGAVVLPVDEVDGIHNIAEDEIRAASLSGEHASAKYTRGVLHWKTRSLRLLDEEQLLSAITRSLT
ncbi:MAG: chemotaxis protein CheW, partial [Pseudomonas sp.]|nr:chemotaxis protein CheW [Pseudomonas sp.]